MDFSKFFIDRPIFAIVLSIIIFAAGLVAIPLLPVGEYPEVVPATVVVKATYPGANPKEIAESVAVPLEEAINGVEDMIYMKSVASSNGSLQVVVTFNAKVDPDTAAVRVQNRVSQALSRLPESVRQYGVTTQKQSPTPLMFVDMFSSNDQFDALYLRNYLRLHVKDELSRIPGIGDVILYGAGDYAMRVWLDPNKLASRGISAEDAISAIRQQNVQVSAGQLGAEPAPQNNEFLISINVQGRLKTEQEFGDIILKTGSDGQVTRLSHVARVQLDADDYTLRVFRGKNPEVAVGIFLTPGANAIEVANAVYAKLDHLSKDFPEGVSYVSVWDPTVFVRESINSVQHTLLEAMVLIVLVVVLFLQTWRASIIPLLAVPVSIVGTFAFLYLLGYSINTLTLFGLVLAIGIVVDDAIVVVENVERVMSEEGLSPKEATRKSMAEITPALVGIALTLSAVFIPMAFFGGSTGVIYRQFSITIVSAMVLSVLVALTLTPALCATLLKPIAKGQHSPHGAPRKGIAGWIDRFFVGFNRRFDRSADSYQRGVGTVVRRGKRMMLVYVLICAGMAVLFLRLPTSFLPNEDQGAISVQITLPPGSSNARLQAVMAQVQKYFAAQPDVVSFNSITGSGGDQSSARGFVRLTNWSQRTRPDQSADAIARKATKDLAAIRDARIFVLLPPAVRGLGANAGFNFQLKDLNGLGHDALVAARDKVLELAAKRPELSNTRSTNLDDTAQLGVDIDDSKAGALGLATVDVNNTLSSALGGTYVNDFLNKGRVKRVYMQGDAPFRMLPQDVGPWTVRNNQGQMVPFSAFSSTRWTYGSPQLQRYNGSPSYEFVGSAAAGVSSGVAMAAVEDIMKEMPAGIGYEWTGASFQERLSGSQAPLLYAVSILFVFLCLAALYESWSVPFSVILVVPLGIVGALLGIGFRGLSNDVYFQVGLLTTVGLSSKNAILIVEFATQLQERGRSVLDATLEAVRLRLRPILMTSLAFGFGVLPLALGSGAGAGGRQAIGTAVLGGMVSATVLGIFFVPVFFVLIRGYFAERKAKQTASETGAAA